MICKVYHVTGIRFAKENTLEEFLATQIEEFEFTFSLPSEGRLPAVVDAKTKESFSGTLFTNRDILSSYRAN